MYAAEVGWGWGRNKSYSREAMHMIFARVHDPPPPRPAPFARCDGWIIYDTSLQIAIEVLAGRLALW